MIRFRVTTSLFSTKLGWWKSSNFHPVVLRDLKPRICWQLMLSKMRGEYYWKWNHHWNFRAGSTWIYSLLTMDNSQCPKKCLGRCNMWVPFQVIQFQCIQESGNNVVCLQCFVRCSFSQLTSYSWGVLCLKLRSVPVLYIVQRIFCLLCVFVSFVVVPYSSKNLGWLDNLDLLSHSWVLKPGTCLRKGMHLFKITCT